ncbi:MAG: hypothetical protein K6T78_02095 [Alicyclobacillus sp.]|nr:hypothetical protein [Alicyclobacillus sp.]
MSERIDTSDAPDRLLGQFVHLEFKQFVDTDYRGTEQADGDLQNGYVVYNDDHKSFGTGTFWTSDDYTIARDALDLIESRHPEFVPYIQATSGFFIGGEWHPVGDGKLS